MTPAQSRELSKLAKGLLPRTTDQQAAQLEEKLAPFEFDLAKEAIKAQGESVEEQRLNLPRLLDRLRTVSAAAAAEQAKAAGRERDERRAAEAAERKRSDEQLAQARAFCRAHAGELDAWRAEVVEATGLARYAKRPVLDSVALTCAIFERFGRTRGAHGTGGAGARGSNRAEFRPHHRPGGDGDAGGRRDVVTRTHTGPAPAGSHHHQRRGDRPRGKAGRR